MPEQRNQKIYGWRQSEIEMEWRMAIEEARKKLDRERLKTGPGMPGILTP